METLASFVLSLLRQVMEVLAGELFKIWTEPDSVKPDVKPVLSRLDPVVDDSSINNDIVNRFSGLH